MLRNICIYKWYTAGTSQEAFFFHRGGQNHIYIYIHIHIYAAVVGSDCFIAIIPVSQKGWIYGRRFSRDNARRRRNEKKKNGVALQFFKDSPERSIVEPYIRIDMRNNFYIMFFSYIHVLMDSPFIVSPPATNIATPYHIISYHVSYHAFGYFDIFLYYHSLRKFGYFTLWCFQDLSFSHLGFPISDDGLLASSAAAGSLPAATPSLQTRLPLQWWSQACIKICHGNGRGWDGMGGKYTVVVVAAAIDSHISSPLKVYRKQQ